MSIKVAINGYGRIGRNILRAHYEGERQAQARSRDRRHQRSGQPRDQRAPDALRHGARKISREGRGGRRRDGRQRRPHQGARAAQSGRAAVGRARRGRGARMHGLVHDQGKGVRASQGRRQESDHLGAGRQGRRRDHRLRRQPPDAQGRAHRHLERVVHDQLPGAAGQAAARQDRRRQRPDDDRCTRTPTTRC